MDVGVALKYYVSEGRVRIVVNDYIVLDIDWDALKAYYDHYGMDAVEDLVISVMTPKLRELIRSYLETILKASYESGGGDG